jgi:hypothetical protein
LLKDIGMNSLTVLLTELESKLPFIAQKNEAISKATVGWHVEHSLLALIKMISAVEHSDPAQYKWTFNLKRSIVLTMGKIPRGKARVPDTVNPVNETSSDILNSMLEKAKQKAALFEQLAADKYFTHPVFGDLRKNKARRVMAIHTNHHIRIINDIAKG